MDLDVIVEIDPRAPPFRELPVVGGQGDEGVAFDRLDQLASAQAEVAATSSFGRMTPAHSGGITTIDSRSNGHGVLAIR